VRRRIAASRGASRELLRKGHTSPRRPPHGIDFKKNSLGNELEFGTVEPEILCCVHKLQEAWNGKCELVEEGNFELLEAKG